ncbi:MAG: hypothetical protein IJ503_10810 [Akkermansia sp.]|nr:hypothetical protein [Akkermansia sp.]
MREQKDEINQKNTNNWEGQFFKYSRWVVGAWSAYLLIMCIITCSTTDTVKRTTDKPNCASYAEDWVDRLLMQLDIEAGTIVDSHPPDYDETKSFWGEAGTFGDMFGALTCLFTGLGIAGLFVTIRQQGEEMQELKRQAQYNAAQSEKVAINEAINLLVQTKSNLACNRDGTPYILDSREVIRGRAVTQLLLDKTYSVLKEFHDYAEESSTNDKVEKAFYDYLEYLSSYLQVSSQVYYILREIDRSMNLSTDDKITITPYVTYNLTNDDKQLLNIIFLRFEYAENLTEYTPELFSWQKAYDVLKKIGTTDDPYIQNIGDEGIRYFMSSMQAGEPCEEAIRTKDAQGNPVTIPTKRLRDDIAPIEALRHLD